MAVRHVGTAALTARSPTAQAGHLGRAAGLVDEDKALWIEIGLRLEPVTPPLQDVGALLLQCMGEPF